MGTQHLYLKIEKGQLVVELTDGEWADTGDSIPLETLAEALRPYLQADVSRETKPKDPE